MIDCRIDWRSLPQRTLYETILGLITVSSSRLRNSVIRKEPKGARTAVRGDCGCRLPGDNGPDQGQVLAAAGG